jgi:hypothetical protein
VLGVCVFCVCAGEAKLGNSTYQSISEKYNDVCDIFVGLFENASRGMPSAL